MNEREVKGVDPPGATSFSYISSSVSHVLNLSEMLKTWSDAHFQPDSLVYIVQILIPVQLWNLSETFIKGVE